MRKKLLCLLCACILFLLTVLPVWAAKENTPQTAENTAAATEAPAAETTAETDVGTNAEPNAETVSEPTEEPERLEPDAYFEPIQTDSIAGWPAGPAVWAESAVVMDMDSGSILYSKNMDAVKYPASITKIMTTLLAIEYASPQDRVTFSEHAIFGIERNSSHIGIRVGEILSMDECWYGMMLESANEVCLSVAEHISGSVEGFVELMNQKAAQLGCTNTHFTNPNGLPDENHYTTAHDMALIAQAAYKNKTFREVCRTQVYRIPKTNVCGEERWLNNHHKMLPENLYAYEGCTGGKTGFTQAALNTLVTYAERNNRRLVCVSLRTNGAQIYADTASMLDYGFNNFQNLTLYSKKSCAGARMLYPSLYFGQPCTVDALRPTTLVTIPITAAQEQVETSFSQDETQLCRTYLYSQYPVGKESLPKTSFYTNMFTPSVKNSPDSMTDAMKDKINNLLPGEEHPDTPVTTMTGNQILNTLLHLPLYLYLLSALLLLLIIMEIILMVKRHKRLKRKKEQKKTAKSK